MPTPNYITHAADGSGKEELDLLVDPPPDLVIEVAITHPSLDKLPSYAALRVPELWQCDGTALHFYELGGETYRAVVNSGLFPFLDAATLTGFIEMGRREDPINMVLVVPHLELTPNNFAHTRTVPKLATKSIRFSSVGEEIRQELFLFSAQFGRGAGARLGT
jgi:hypothetical protein